MGGIADGTQAIRPGEGAAGLAVEVAVIAVAALMLEGSPPPAETLAAVRLTVAECGQRPDSRSGGSTTATAELVRVDPIVMILAACVTNGGASSAFGMASLAVTFSMDEAATGSACADGAGACPSSSRTIEAVSAASPRGVGKGVHRVDPGTDGGAAPGIAAWATATASADLAVAAPA